jgi:hypothetical protein
MVFVALHFACKRKKKEIIDLLLKLQNINLYSCNNNNDIPICVSILHNNIYALKKMIQIDPSLVQYIHSYTKNTLLHVAALKVIFLCLICLRVIMKYAKSY